VVIWSAINGRELSRVAGRIWRMEDELWLRNLSLRHELYIRVPGTPPPPPLRPRLDTQDDPGPACAIPGPVAYVLGPGGCELLVYQRRVARSEVQLDLPGEQTFSVPPVPDGLRMIAAALCEPLLNGGQLPATYKEVAERTGTPEGKRTRNQVGDLCRLYVEEVPELRLRIIERRQKEEQELALPADPELRRGVWHFGRVDDDAESDPPDVRRRRALALPDYYEVAHLLVRRRLITLNDVRKLPSAGGAGGGPP
jgi:hypothetical protein